MRFAKTRTAPAPDPEPIAEAAEATVPRPSTAALAALESLAERCRALATSLEALAEVEDPAAMAAAAPPRNDSYLLTEDVRHGLPMISGPAKAHVNKARPLIDEARLRHGWAVGAAERLAGPVQTPADNRGVVEQRAPEAAEMLRDAAGSLDAAAEAEVAFRTPARRCPTCHQVVP